MVVYLVRSFRTYARIRSLTTGTFNLVVKDRIAFRLSGAPSGLDGSATRANPAVLETLQTYSWRKTLSIRASHSISTPFPHWEGRLRRAGRKASPLEHRHARSRFLTGLSARFGMTMLFVAARFQHTSARNGMASRSGLTNADIPAHAEAEDRKLRKDPTFGGPCFEGTLRKAYWLFPNRVPWPGRLESLRPSHYFRCRTATRVANNTTG